MSIKHLALLVSFRQPLFQIKPLLSTKTLAAINMKMNNLITLTIAFLFSLNISGQTNHKYTIYFQNNETDLNKNNTDLLEFFIDSVAISNYCKFTITGYADNKGDTKLNYILSEKRSQSVKDYFITKGYSSDNIIVKAIGSILDPNKNKNNTQRQLNRKVEINISCSNKEIEEITSIAISPPNFENDTIIRGKNGTELKIKKGAFYPIKIKDVDIQIKELSTYCDSIPDDVETLTENGICLASGGMAFISATYKKKLTKKSFKDAFEVKIPIQKNDSTMDFYTAVRQKNGIIRWKKSDGKIITEKGIKYYIYETNYIATLGVNCDKTIPGCKIDVENGYTLKTWVKLGSVKYYIKDKFSFYTARRISKRQFSIPSTINPDQIYIEVLGIKAFSIRHYRNKKFSGEFETKKIYSLSELSYNSRKKRYKIRAKFFKIRTSKINERQIKQKMNCN